MNKYSYRDMGYNMSSYIMKLQKQKLYLHEFAHNNYLEYMEKAQIILVQSNLRLNKGKYLI